MLNLITKNEGLHEGALVLRTLAMTNEKWKMANGKSSLLAAAALGFLLQR